MKRETFKASDGKDISLVVWDKTDSPKAVVQIIHGMAEHAARYDEFAQRLNAHGYIAVGDDHRAHGHTDAERLGMAEEGKDLFRDTVRDEAEITEMLKARYGLPVIIFGHSYGSFVTQAYLLEHSDKIAACVLSGSARQPSIAVKFGKFLSNRKFKKHADEAGKFFAKLTFVSYDKKIGEGHNQWLSRNTDSNAAYTADPLCDYTCSNGFYKHFFNGLNRLNASDYAEVRKDLPLFVIYGKMDYVGGCGKLVEKLVRKYEKAGLTVSAKGYDGARHELTNEINRDEVYADSIAFFDGVTG